MTRSWRAQVARVVLAVFGVLALLVGAVGCSAAVGDNSAPRGSAGVAANSTDAAPSEYVIAGGGKAGVYYSYGEQLAFQAQQALGLDITVTSTEGSVDNLKRVAAGEAVLGFSQGDTAADAMAGVGAFSEPLPVTAVARVYDEYVHVVVPARSEMTQISELAGHTVSLGAENSGVQVIAHRVLEAAGVPPESVSGPALGLDASLAALLTGEIEAFFWVGGLPTPGIERLAGSLPIKLLPLSANLVERVNAAHAGVYRTAEFPASAYNTGRETPTMTVPNYLIAYDQASPGVIRDLTRVLFNWQATIASKVHAAAFLDRRQAIFTEPMPLHPGAADYYISTRQ